MVRLPKSSEKHRDGQLRRYTEQINGDDYMSTIASNSSGTTIDPATEPKQDTAIANQTNKTQMTQITDGTDEVAVNTDGSLLANQNVGNILGNITYDEIAVTRVSNNISKLEYKLASAVQATINVTRDGANKISNIARA